MEQKIVTVFIPFKEKGVTNLDSQISILAESGYMVKQIVSCSIDANNVPPKENTPRIPIPTLAVTILLEKMTP